MSHWISKLVGGTILVVLSTAVGRGLLYWVQSQGGDPEKWVASAIAAALRPENRDKLSAGLAIFGLLVAMLVVSVLALLWQRSGRPTRGVIESVLRAVNEIEMHCLESASPSDEDAVKALDYLKISSGNLKNDKSMGPVLASLIENATDYISLCSAERRALLGEDHVKENQARNAAISNVSRFREKTRWVVYEH